VPGTEREKTNGLSSHALRNRKRGRKEELVLLIKELLFKTHSSEGEIVILILLFLREEEPRDWKSVDHFRTRGREKKKGGEVLQSRLRNSLRS